MPRPAASFCAISVSNSFPVEAGSGVGLYVHLPWCVRKCPYCDFNSHVPRTDIPEAAYIDALLADLDEECALNGTPEVMTVFIGGGTPSLFSPAAIERLLEGIASRCRLAVGAEITLEANPGSSEAARFSGFRAAGVNRLSIGIQSFDDACLTALGRVHNAVESRAAIDAAAKAGFTNVNLDLMFGLPGSNERGAMRDLDAALGYAPAHLSWYELTLEPGTPFAARPPPLPRDDQVDAIYTAGRARLAEAGYEHYEISAHARPERQAQHNLNYWRYGDYIGIGAGAHGKRTVAGQVLRRVKTRHPQRYMNDRETEQLVIEVPDTVIEFMLNALRLKSGFTFELLRKRAGVGPEDASIAGPLAEAIAQEWLIRADEGVRPTELGYRFVTDLQMLFLEANEVESHEPR